ncbi:MAG: hypothetical protein ABTQ32_21800 [Myxococcaceae bacterium]
MRLNRTFTTAIVLTSLEAFTSEHHDQIELKDLVTRSTVIAVVVPATPATVKSEIAIAPGEKYPPYTRIRSRYVVKEVLHAEGTKLEPGKTIEVDPADFDTRLTVHKRYHLEGVRKIPIYTHYSPQKPPAQGSMIVFLAPAGDGWQYTANGAIEHLDTRKAIEALLKKAQ